MQRRPEIPGGMKWFIAANIVALAMIFLIWTADNLRSTPDTFNRDCKIVVFGWVVGIVYGFFWGQS